MNPHPDMASQLAADRQSELRLSADRARLAATAPADLGRSGLVSRLIGWWRSGAAADAAGAAAAAGAGDRTVQAPWAEGTAAGGPGAGLCARPRRASAAAGLGWRGAR